MDNSYDELYFCCTCGNQLPRFFFHNANHKIIPMQTVKYWSDPVVFNVTDNKWYYWDETWAFRIGPFDSEALARENLAEYGKLLNGYSS